MSVSKELRVYRLGRVEYEDGLRLQELFGQARAEGAAPDSLLLLEHPPVLTFGRAAKRENVLAPEAALRDRGVELFETNRGGDVTYHGPGQVVGYPIVQLPPERQDVRRYVRDLEEAIIQTLARFGITAGRIPKWTGVWVDAEAPTPRKIAAIGVHIARWQTSHGFALNVMSDLAHFSLIVPCGIREAGVTSMAQELGRDIDLREVELVLADTVPSQLGLTPVTVAAELRTVSVAVLREGRQRPEVLCLRRTEERGGFWQIVTGRIDASETPGDAARRETLEETGQALEVFDLGYRHSFALGDRLPPLVAEATAFFARWKEGAEVRLDPHEHVDAAWLPIEPAVQRLPFKGLQVAVRLAARRF